MVVTYVAYNGIEIIDDTDYAEERLLALHDAEMRKIRQTIRQQRRAREQNATIRSKIKRVFLQLCKNF